MEKIRQRQQEERSSPLGKLIKSPSEQNNFSYETILHYIPVLAWTVNSTLQYLGNF